MSKRRKRKSSRRKAARGRECQCGLTFYPWSRYNPVTFVKTGKGGRARIRSRNYITVPQTFRDPRTAEERTYHFRESMLSNETIRVYWPRSGRYMECPQCLARRREARATAPAPRVLPTAPSRPTRRKDRALRHRTNQSKARR